MSDYRSDKRRMTTDISEDRRDTVKRPKQHIGAREEAQWMRQQADEHERRGQMRPACELRLRAAQKDFGDGHANTLKAMYSLANVYFQLQLFRLAGTLQCQALSRQKEMLGSNHLDAVRGMHDLASSYISQNLLKQAEKLERHVVFVRAQVLGKTDIETLWSMYQLAIILHKQGRLIEAQILDQKILHLNRNKLAEHAETGTALHLPPSIFDSIKQNESAISEIEILAQLALNEAVSSLPSGNATQEGSELNELDIATPSTASINQDMISEELATQTETCIGTRTSMSDVLRLLVKAQCLDMTENINTSQCPKVPHAGGRFGDVWRGELVDHTSVAIKCLRLHTGSEESIKNVKRAARELYYWSKAKHENVLELAGIAIFKGRLAMISPWMTNGTLHAYIIKHPEVNRWELCKQVVEGLAYIHEARMVHGDLKAVNILVSNEGVAKLSDFGNAILSDHSLAFTATTNIGGGTSRWMAPELLHEEDEGGEVPDRSMPADVYALGMTILEIITGEAPYAERKTDAWVIQAVTEGIMPQRPLQLQSRSRFGDKRWEMLIECWRRRPRDRPTATMVKHQVYALT